MKGIYTDQQSTERQFQVQKAVLGLHVDTNRANTNCCNLSTEYRNA
jgi:hypothetical protein